MADVQVQGPPKKSKYAQNYERSQMSKYDAGYEHRDVYPKNMVPALNQLPTGLVPPDWPHSLEGFKDAMLSMGHGVAHGATLGLSDKVFGSDTKVESADKLGTAVGEALPLGEGYKLAKKGVGAAKAAFQAAGPAMEVAGPYVDMAARWLGGPVGVAHGIYTKIRRAKMLSAAAKAAQEAEAAKGLEEMAPSVLGGDREAFAQGMGATKKAPITEPSVPSQSPVEVPQAQPTEAMPAMTQPGTPAIDWQAKMMAQRAAQGRPMPGAGASALIGGFGGQPQPAPLSTNVSQAKMMILAGQKTGQSMEQVRQQMAAIYDPATLQFVFAALPNRLPQ